MQRYLFLSVAIIALASCDAATVSSGSSTAVKPQTTPITWKENTPAAQRLADGQECLLQSVGANVNMTEAEINQRAAAVSLEQRNSFRDRCMSIKGYTHAEGKVCNRKDVETGNFVRSSEVNDLPPLSSVRCFYPEAGGFVTA